MFDRVVLPLLETAGSLAGRVVKPSLNVLVGASSGAPEDRPVGIATRALFRTNHPAGRAAFTVGLFGGAVILERHINKH